MRIMPNYRETVSRRFECLREGSPVPTPQQIPPLTVQQAAVIFQLQPDAIRDWIRRKVIAAIRLPGGQYRIPRAEVDRLLHGPTEVES
jgi:excisionase family DNA binding protein